MTRTCLLHGAPPHIFRGHRLSLRGGGGARATPKRTYSSSPSQQENTKTSTTTSATPVDTVTPKQQQEEDTQTSTTTSTTPVRTAKEAAMAYYNNYNNKNIAAVLELIAEDCIYEDLIYQEPFRGRTEIAAYFDKIERLVPKDIKFVVEDITDGDPMRVGVRWHVELEGVAQFPFSRGVSFYEINTDGQIVFARDIVEPTFKPGAAALQGISVIAPLVRRLGPAADPSNLSNLPIAAGAVSVFWLTYISYVMFSTAAPGLPVWQTTPEALQTVLHESFNFFYVNIGLSSVGLSPVPSIAEHPVDEALFNFVNAWGLMLWPVMVADPLGKNIDTKTRKLPLWVATMFLTNVFFPIYLALRLVPKGKNNSSVDVADSKTIPAQHEPQKPEYAPVFGGIALAVGAFSLFWAAAGRPGADYGDLADRLHFYSDMVSSNRVFWAFNVDAVLYSVWQAWLLGDLGAAAWQRFLPFFGMAAWLLEGKDTEEQTDR